MADRSFTYSNMFRGQKGKCLQLQPMKLKQKRGQDVWTCGGSSRRQSRTNRCSWEKALLLLQG